MSNHAPPVGSDDDLVITFGVASTAPEEQQAEFNRLIRLAIEEGWSFNRFRQEIEALPVVFLGHEDGRRSS